MSRQHAENDNFNTTAMEAVGVDREHVMRDVMVPTERHVQQLQEGFNAFNEHYQGYLLDRVSRLMQSEYGKDFLSTVEENARKGEPLYALLLSDLQQRKLIPQQA